jgi:uncharacterized Zn finger protein
MMGDPVACPNCGEEDTIEVKHDAWACFQVTGLDSGGHLAVSRDFDTQVFDHNVIECSECGTVFDEEELARRLKKAS